MNNQTKLPWRSFRNHCLISALLTLPVVAAAAASAPASSSRSLESVLEQTRRNLVVDRAYAPGAEVELTLGVGEGARLKFAENAAGVSEFLFRYEPGSLHVLFACTGEQHNWTILTDKRPTDSRDISTARAPVWMKCKTEWRVQDGKARVAFLAAPLSERAMREIKEERRRREQERMRKLRRVLEWDEAETNAPIRMVLPSADDPALVALRTKYDLEKVVSGAGDDYERLRRLVKWAHDRWQHTGDNTPSRSDPLTILAEAAQGKRFRCVEYSIVVAGCAQSLGMPARRLGLKREDVETAQSGAGHVVAEVWLNSRKKWVLADGQWDALPEKDGVPLNAVEFQDAFARNAPGLKIRSSSDIKADSYLGWVAPYLYYFDFSMDQRFSAPQTDHAEGQRYQPQRGAVMLVPKGAERPAVFQRKTPMKNLTYISDPRAFYPVPTRAAAPK